KEEWSTGSDWGTNAVAPVAVNAVPTDSSKVAQ
ncbi:MAG: hypothetical protein RLZZ518_1325, partial [Actinomycetota bacterium]